VITVNKNDLITAATKAKLEIDDQIEAFIEAIDRGTIDPDNFASFSNLENLLRRLKLETHKTYSDMMSTALSALDTSEVNASKKDNSSRME
jgi:hypothetical protein